MTVTVTRVINACVLLEIDGDFVLTDPCFREPVGVRFREPFGLQVEDLPTLTAIVVGHRVPDHWQPRSLRDYRHRASTPVFVPTRHMARTARQVGFVGEMMRWGERSNVGRLVIDCVPGERVTGMRTNAYIIRSDTVTVLVATEARHVLPEVSVDVAVLPIDGARLLGRPLVMDATTAAATANRLNATLVPIHFSQQPRPPLLRCPSGPDDLPPDIHVASPGVRTAVHPAPGNVAATRLPRC